MSEQTTNPAPDLAKWKQPEVLLFLAAVTAVATRKPFATGKTFVTDVAYRTIPGFHLPNFCDTFDETPFLPYESPA